MNIRRAVFAVPFCTFIAGLRRHAMVAPFVLDEPMNTTSFITYLKRCLVPTPARRHRDDG